MKRKTALEQLGQLQPSHRCSFYSGHRVDDFANLLMAVVNCVVPCRTRSLGRKRTSSTNGANRSQIKGTASANQA